MASSIFETKPWCFESSSRTLTSGPPSGSLRYTASRPPYYRPVPPRLPAIAAAATTTTMSAAALFARRHRTGFSNSHIPAAVFRSVEFLNSIRCFLIGGHLDEAETLAAAGVAIGDDLGRLNTSRLSENFLK